MIRPVVHDPIRLSAPSAPALLADKPTAQDLRDTLLANLEHCVGMAANMIGVNKRIIAVALSGDILLMLNPQIGVQYQDLSFARHTQVFLDFPAQIIQHEIDHCNGILI